MKYTPTPQEIQQLHKKYAPSQEAFNLVFTHCQIVWEIAKSLIDKTNLAVDKEKVKAGCLLHDIGVYRLYLPDGQIDHKNYITHGIRGYELLKAEGFSEETCRIASCHVGIGLSKQEIIEEGIPIPPVDYFAETIEEQLVTYADKFHTKTSPPKFLTAETYIEHLKKFGGQKVERFLALQAKFGTPDVKPLAKKYHSELA